MSRQNSKTPSVSGGEAHVFNPLDEPISPKQLRIEDVPYRRTLVLKKFQEYENVIAIQKNELRIAHMNAKELRRLLTNALNEINQLKTGDLTSKKLKRDIESTAKRNSELEEILQENTGKIAILNEQISVLKKENDNLQNLLNNDANLESREMIEKLSQELDIKDSVIANLKKEVTKKTDFIHNVSTRSIQLSQSLKSPFPSNIITLSSLASPKDLTLSTKINQEPLSDGSLAYSSDDSQYLNDVPPLNAKTQKIVFNKNPRKKQKLETNDSQYSDEEYDDNRKFQTKNKRKANKKDGKNTSRMSKNSNLNRRQARNDDSYDYDSYNSSPQERKSNAQRSNAYTHSTVKRVAKKPSKRSNTTYSRSKYSYDNYSDEDYYSQQSYSHSYSRSSRSKNRKKIIRKSRVH